jgi:colicin import membrane protein
LKFEGFAEKDAKRAIDRMKVDWNTEAEQKAKSYVDMSGFSRSGLIEQLTFEGFTRAQAAHGADFVGL